MNNILNNNVSVYEYKTKRKLATGEIKYYIQKQKYNKKGTKFTEFINKYTDIIKNKDLRPTDKLNKLYDIMTKEEKNKYSVSQLRNLIYRY